MHAANTRNRYNIYRSYIYIFDKKLLAEEKQRGGRKWISSWEEIDQKKCVFNQVEDGEIEESIPEEDEEELETKLTMALMTRICISRAGI